MAPPAPGTALCQGSKTSRLLCSLSGCVSPPHPPCFLVSLPGLFLSLQPSLSAPTAQVRCPSAAAVHLYQVPTLLALDGAAPAKLAAASLHHLRLGRLEAPATAQELTAIHGQGCPVALAARGTKDTALGVPVTEVWAGQQVDQVMSCVGLEARALGHQELAVTDPLGVNLCRPLKFFLEDVAHFAERRHDLPARAYLTGTRHAVALALHLHVGQESLGSRRWLPVRPGTPCSTPPMPAGTPAGTAAPQTSCGAGGQDEPKGREDAFKVFLSQANMTQGDPLCWKQAGLHL